MKKINIGLLISVIVFIISAIGIYMAGNTDYRNSGFVPVGLAELLIWIAIAVVSMISAIISVFVSKKNQEPEIPSKGYLITKKIVLIVFILMILFFAFSFKKFL